MMQKINEYCSLMENNTSNLFPFPNGRKLARCKWLYRTKYELARSVD